MTSALLPSLSSNLTFIANFSVLSPQLHSFGPCTACAAFLLAILAPCQLRVGAGPLRTGSRCSCSLKESAVLRRAREEKAPRTRLRNPVCTAKRDWGAPQPPYPTSHLSSDSRPRPSLADRSAPTLPWPGLPGPGAGTPVPQPRVSILHPPSSASDNAKHLSPHLPRGTSR